MSSKCSDVPEKALGAGPCARRLWVFLVLGALDIVFGLVSVGLYFNIQAITTSDDLTEVLPGYVICLVVSIGVLQVRMISYRWMFSLNEDDERGLKFIMAKVILTSFKIQDLDF
jgi:H+/Cl- antiporter ClcA